jgi:SAM-dependent methyltransferase
MTIPGGRRPEDFDAAYAGTPPWDIGRPQPDFARVATAGLLRGRVLDVGCGTGEHALLAASLGFDATGVDTSPSAIARAQAKAEARNLRARFLVWDALELARLGEQFETVLDSGLLHVFDDDARLRYTEGLGAAVAPGGYFYLLVFSDRQPGVWGPRRLAEAEIRDAFSRGWEVESIERSRMDVNLDPGYAEAWFAAIRRT